VITGNSPSGKNSAKQNQQDEKRGLFTGDGAG
jgi:hypothetical protein